MYNVSFPGLGLDFKINPVAFSIGTYDVRWYGIIITCGMLLALAYAYFSAKRFNVEWDTLFDCVLVGIVTGIIGARLFFVLFSLDKYINNPLDIFKIHEGGLAIYGGIIGGFIGGVIVAKVKKAKILPILDVAVLGFLIGQGIGRWGNFFNQEAFGTTTTMPWGMWSESTRTYLSRFCPDLVALSPVHPTFLYESVADLIIFIILLQVRKKSTHAFETSCTYFVLYGAVRFFIEGLRTDSLYIAGTQIRASQALSLFLLLFGLFYIAFAHLKGWERKPFPAKLFAEAAPVREASKAETEEDSKKESEEGSSEAEDAGEEADKDEEVEEKTKDSKDSKAED